MFHIKAAKNKKHSEFTMVSGGTEDRWWFFVRGVFFFFFTAAEQRLSKAMGFLTLNLYTRCVTIATLLEKLLTSGDWSEIFVCKVMGLFLDPVDKCKSFPHYFQVIFVLKMLVQLTP